MNNLCDFFDWKIMNEEKNNDKNDKIEIKDNSDKNNYKEIKINNNTYKIHDDSVTNSIGDELEDKSVEKYIKKLSDSADDVIDTNKASNLYRLSGGIKKIKDKIKNIDFEYFNDTTEERKSFRDYVINDLKNVGDHKYVSFSEIFKKEKIDSQKINSMFSVRSSGIVRGESLLPALFLDVRRKDPTEEKRDGKGDDALIDSDGKNEKDIEVKSAGTPISIVVPDENEYGPKYVCAYSIARYIIGRNLGDIYLVIFNNGIGEKIIKFEDKTDEPVTDSGIENQDKDKTDISNELGKDEATGFFIMYCGESVKSNSNGFEEKVKNLSKELMNIIKIEVLENNKSDFKNFIFGYNNGKIICYVNNGYKDKNGEHVSFNEMYTKVNK